MISILIPVYNQDVNKLVARLSAGLSHLQSRGEIIVMEDGSQPAWYRKNERIASLPGVRHIIQTQNQGRLKVRLLLAQEAKGAWLLFLDGDSGIPAEDFLRRYETALQAHTTVIVGGRQYQSTPPGDCALRLHWKYGSQRESRGPHRQHQPAFMTNNFLIAASLFRQLDLDNHWGGYGHEDTWMGIRLEQAAIPVCYINNPVIHEGLEPAHAFMQKSENALLNLQKIMQHVSEAQLARHVKLFRIYRQLKKWRLQWAPVWAYRLLSKTIQRNLHSCNPSLQLFDLYRLQYFIRLNKQ